MKVLIAEDEAVPRRALQATLQAWGFEVEVAENGTDALKILETRGAPSLALLDWVMPELEGPAVCARARAFSGNERKYFILLTARGDKADIVAGLECGADDYITKPFDPAELRARLRVGQRFVELHEKLAERARSLQLALDQVKQLRGLLPICCYCKNVRNDADYWERVEGYIGRHSDAEFTHTICPDCYVREIEPKLHGQGASDKSEVRSKSSE